MHDNQEIEKLRPLRNALNPDIPYHFLHEEEPNANGVLQKVNTIFLTGKECSFKCLMCDLWKNTLTGPTPPGAILKQIDYALDRLPPADVVKLYNNGNFFDPKAVPPGDHPGIIERLQAYSRVVVENHPKLCGDNCLEFNNRLNGMLEIAIGLETIHPHVLPKLNKQLTPDDFRKAASFLRRNGIDVRAFILLNPPYLTDVKENIEWVMRTVKFAFDSGTQCCSIIATRSGNGIMETLQQQGHYTVPSLNTLEEVFETALLLKQGRVFVDTWDIGFLSNCPKCFEARKERLEAMNLHQQVYPQITCNCHDFDILIAGAGFGGSLMALVLNSLGFRVCLVEKGQHPRFAVGESSTPIADMILRQLAQQYNLPWLKDFSRYGSWQQAHPEIVCGIKRGFSYFKHHPGTEFTTDANHTNELLVAASTDDVQSDTNWLRADFDAFLVDKVKEADIAYFDRTEIVSAERNTVWHFLTGGDNPTTLTASFFIDATGSGGLLYKLLGVKSSSDDFLTDSFAVFSHFNNVPRWIEILQKAGIPTGEFPYDPDNSALHQVLDEGWLWMLRFNDERISLGFALNGQKNNYRDIPATQIWAEMIEKYPTIHGLLKDAQVSAQPGTIIKSGRLQRKTDRCFGPGWAALPHTAGFVDPLFSSGIAHSLAGIHKMAGILQQYWNQEDELYRNLAQYERSVFEELKFIDQLVAGCYQTMHCFELFNAWSMLYFAATIAYEQRLLKNMPPGYFLGANDQTMRDIVDLSYHDLLEIIEKQQITDEDISQFTALIRQRIAPVNIAGLLNPALKNMYHHTAVNI